MEITVEKDDTGIDLVKLTKPNGQTRQIRADQIYIRASDGALMIRHGKDVVSCENAIPEIRVMIDAVPFIKKAREAGLIS